MGKSGAAFSALSFAHILLIALPLVAADAEIAVPAPGAVSGNRGKASSAEVTTDFWPLSVQSGDLDTCFSTADVNGDDVALTVADLQALSSFVNDNGPAPLPPFQGDLNGDGFINQSDIDLFNCYFTFGLSCFPQFPVPVPCITDTSRGCCCTPDTCVTRSPLDCLAMSGEYRGDGMTCDTCVPPPPGMVLWLPFDEGSPGPSTNLSGPSDGVQTGSLLTAAGKVAGALQLDGVTSYVDVPSYDGIFGLTNPGTGDFTIDAWVYRLADGFDSQALMCKRTVSGPELGFLFYLVGSSSELGLVLYDGSPGLYLTSVYVPLNDWHHVAVTVTRGNALPVRFYLDGVLVEEPFNPTPHTGSISNDEPLRVGAYNGPGVAGGFHGVIDEVEMFSRALSSAEIRSIYQAGSDGKCKCACLRLGDLDGNGFIDAVDLAVLIDVVFFGASDVQDSSCPTTRGDFNGDGIADAVDLAFLIDHVFFSGPGPVDPCTP